MGKKEVKRVGAAELAPEYVNGCLTYAEVYDTQREHLKVLKDARSVLLTAMKSEGLTEVVGDGWKLLRSEAKVTKTDYETKQKEDTLIKKLLDCGLEECIVQSIDDGLLTAKCIRDPQLAKKLGVKVVVNERIVDKLGIHFDDGKKVTAYGSEGSR